MLPSLFKNLFIIVLLFGLLYGVTLISPTIKKQADTQIAKVLGASTSKIAETSLPETLKKDAATQLEVAKEKALEVDLNDILQGIVRLRKIQKDAQSFISTTTESVNKLLK